MFELQGRYGKAKVFTDNVDDKAVGQIVNFLNHPVAKDGNVRIMPDTHFAKGAVVGTTMRVTDKIIPNLVGIDIGCGMLCVEVKGDLDLPRLDEAIRQGVPSGPSLRGKQHPLFSQFDASGLTVAIDMHRPSLAIGTLGGGNHFIELNEAADGRRFLVIHSGSRNLGVQVALHHQNIAIRYVREKGYTDIADDLAFLEGALMHAYLNDLVIAQHFARLNREAMADVIMKSLGWKSIGSLDTIHNYVDPDTIMLRKGAISAQKGEDVLIPINMRDGSILARGKGNDDWNQSAPHGAGRFLSRSEAKNTLSLEAFTETMKGVYSTSVRQGTLDESPFAYKPIDEIIANTTDTIDVIDVLRPLYNFKSSSYPDASE